LSALARDSRSEGTLADYVLLALLQVGGAEGMVDLEHVAVKAHRMMPNMFRWRYYDYPDVAKVRTAFKDGDRRGSNPLVLKGDRGRARMLTAEGLQRARKLERRLTPADGRDDAALRRPINRDLVRMERHPGFLMWQHAGIKDVDRYDLADMLECAPGSPRAVFLDRVERARTLATEWDRDELAAFLMECGIGLDDLMKDRG
jgi:hypothetical protein